MIHLRRNQQTSVRPGHGLNHPQTKPGAPRDSLVQVLDYLMDQATPRDERAVADYLVGYSIQPAEGVYHLVDGELVWETPTDENVHIVVSVRDAVDGRFLPALDVQATLMDTNGNVIGTRPQPFVWHPWLYDYGYGCNWKIPADGKYTLRIDIESRGDGGTAPTTVDFRNIRIVI